MLLFLIMTDFINRIFLRLMLIFLIVVSCKNDITKKGNNDESIKENIVQDHLEKARLSTQSINQRVKSVDLAYNISSTLNSDSLRINKIREISGLYYDLQEYEKAMKMDLEMLRLAKLISDSLAIAEAHTNIGIYYRFDNLEDAYKNFYEAEKIYNDISIKKQGNSKENIFKHGRVLLDIALLLKNVKDYSESEDLTIKAIEKFKISEDLRFLPICYTNLGILAKYLERYEDAIEYHKKAIEYALNTENEELRKVISFNNIGTVYKSKGEYNKAKEFYEKALSYKDLLSKNQSRYARLLDNLAYVIYLEDNNDKKLPELFYEAFYKREEIDDKSGIATSALHLAEYFKDFGKDSLAKSYALMAERASEEVNNNEELLGAYSILSDLQDSSALEYAKKYIKLNDSLVREERLFQNKFARIRFETDQLEEEKAQISRENEFLVIAVLGLTALFLLVYIIFRQQQSNKELLFAQAQQESNEEIYRLLLNQQVKLEEGRQMEQQRMSEELHDGVLGRLFGVRLSLDGLNQRANDGFTEARNKYIDELKAIEKEIRLISHDLGTDTLTPDVAYIDVVESLISDLCDAHKMDFEFNNDENIDWEEIDDQKKVNLLRILQESLQNIFKHAKATQVKISFDYTDNNINLTVLDNGVGFKSNKVKRGIGLKNITNRVGQMSGVVDFISNKDRGTTVHVSVPV